MSPASFRMMGSKGVYPKRAKPAVNKRAQTPAMSTRVFGANGVKDVVGMFCKPSVQSVPKCDGGLCRI